MKEKIEDLAKIFAKYEIYPKNGYTRGTPARLFQEKYPENYYSKNLERFLRYQDYQVETGADLPWWGENFFTDEASKKAMIISQNSYAVGAGSVVFFAHLFGIIEKEEDYNDYNCNLDAKYLKKNKKSKWTWRSFLDVKEFIAGCYMNKDFIYITDAFKVDSNKESRNLIDEEIEFCKSCGVKILIILGSEALSLLEGRNIKFKEVVGEKIKVQGLDCVVVPFPTGQGKAGRNRPRKIVKDWMAKAQKSVKELLLDH